MVRIGDVIDNPVTGERMTFLLTGRETAGELLSIDMRVRPGGFIPSEHIHPEQEERFLITNGEIALRILRACRDLDSLCVTDVSDYAVAHDHGLMLQHPLFVHRNNVDIDERDGLRPRGCND